MAVVETTATFTGSSEHGWQVYCSQESRDATCEPLEAERHPRCCQCSPFGERHSDESQHASRRGRDCGRDSRGATRHLHNRQAGEADRFRIVIKYPAPLPKRGEGDRGKIYSKRY